MVKPNIITGPLTALAVPLKPLKMPPIARAIHMTKGSKADDLK